MTETASCDRCGDPIPVDAIYTDEVGNVLCRDCWQRSEDARALMGEDI